MRDRFVLFVERVRPHFVDSPTFLLIAFSFALGVFFLAWHAETFRFEIEGTNLGWVAIVAFGMAWHGRWGSGWRVGAGMVVGGLATLATFYGAVSTFPITPISVGLWLGVATLIVAFAAHVVPRIISFAGVAVGIGIGVAAARSLPVRPTTPADDLFALMLTMSMIMVVGVFGSLALRAIVVQLGGRRSGGALVSFIPRMLPRASQRARVSARRVRQQRKAG